MRHQLGCRLMHIVVRRAGEFELPAWFQRNRATAGDVEHADDVVAFHDRLPAEQIVHAFEQGADAALAGIGNRTMIGDREGELLVLGADPEFRLRLATRLQPSDEFVARPDGGHVDLVARHAEFRAVLRVSMILSENRFPSPIMSRTCSSGSCAEGPRR